MRTASHSDTGRSSINAVTEAATSARHPALGDTLLAELPPLTGYLATTPRPEAAVVLRAPGGDPLLAVWQYGGVRSRLQSPGAGVR